MYNYERHQTRRHQRHNRQSFSSESEYYDCVLIMLYALAISVSMSEFAIFSSMMHDGRASRITICLSRANYFQVEFITPWKWHLNSPCNSVVGEERYMYQT